MSNFFNRLFNRYHLEYFNGLYFLKKGKFYLHKGGKLSKNISDDVIYAKDKNLAMFYLLNAKLYV